MEREDNLAEKLNSFFICMYIQEELAEVFQMLILFNGEKC